MGSKWAPNVQSFSHSSPSFCLTRKRKFTHHNALRKDFEQKKNKPKILQNSYNINQYGRLRISPVKRIKKYSYKRNVYKYLQDSSFKKRENELESGSTHKKIRGQRGERGIFVKIRIKSLKDSDQKYTAIFFF